MSLTFETVKRWKEEAAISRQREWDNGIEKARCFLEANPIVSHWVEDCILNDNFKPLELPHINDLDIARAFESRHFFKLYMEAYFDTLRLDLMISFDGYIVIFKLGAL